MTDKELTLIAFLEGTGTDNCGRTLKDIWNFTEKEREVTHNYIQWLFPLSEPSAVNKEAVLLTEEMISYIRDSKQIQENLLISFQYMVSFYGFFHNPDTDEITLIQEPKELFISWLTPFNHNFKRISRILYSMRLCGLSVPAENFYKILMNLTEDIKYCKTAQKYWKYAIERKE